MGRLCKSSCGVALIACALLSALWVVSYHAKATVRLPVSAGSTRIEIYSYRGQLAVSTVGDFPVAQRAQLFLHRSDASRATRWDTLFWADSWAGFSAEDGRISVPNAIGESVSRPWLNLILPYWLIVVVALVGPVRDLFVALRARRRLTHGQCATCGYDFELALVHGECPACAARQHVVGLSPRTHLA